MWAISAADKPTMAGGYSQEQELGVWLRYCSMGRDVLTGTLTAVLNTYPAPHPQWGFWATWGYKTFKDMCKTNNCFFIHVYFKFMSCMKWCFLAVFFVYTHVLWHAVIMCVFGSHAFIRAEYMHQVKQLFFELYHHPAHRCIPSLSWHLPRVSYSLHVPCKQLFVFSSKIISLLLKLIFKKAWILQCSVFVIMS